MRRGPLFLWAAMAGTVGAALAFPAGSDAQALPGTVGRQAEFAAASAEFAVPDSVLLAVSYQETLWESHSAGQASTTGQYGPMALTKTPAEAADARGEGPVTPMTPDALTAAATLLLGRSTIPTGTRHSKVITINPVFARNVQTVTDCEQSTPVAPQAASFVYLRTAPNASAPLFNDPGLYPTSSPGAPGSTCAADWGDKASAGQQFAVAGRQGDWVAIWWDGATVWFENPTTCPTATPTSTLVVRPKTDTTTVPTYGVAYPNPSEFPSDIPAAAMTPLPYTIQPGQSYVYGGVTPTDYYLSLIHISEPTRRTPISYAVFCLKKKKKKITTTT